MSTFKRPERRPEQVNGRDSGIPRRPTRRAQVHPLIALQQSAGNRAATVVAQLQAAPPRERIAAAGLGEQPHLIEPARPPTGSSGPKLRAALEAQLPGLLASLSADQLAEWQASLDYHANKEETERKLTALWNEYEYYGEVREAHPEYKARKRQIEAAVLPPPAHESTTIDGRLLLSDDIRTPPQFNQKLEMDFREWAITQITQRPVEVRYANPDFDQFNLQALSGLAAFTKGVVTPDALRRYFPEEYAARVTQHPLWDQLRTELHDMDGAAYDSQVDHKDWLDKRKITFWFVIPVHTVAEAFGSGSAALPEYNIWEEPEALIRQSYELLRAQKLELLVPILEMAAQKTYAAIAKVEAYDKRVTSGSERVLKWANRLKTLGSIAAGVASGGLGLTGSALVAGGYTFAQEGLQQASEMSHGLRKDMDWAGLTTDAAVNSLMAVVGGSLQARFQAAWQPRLASLGPTLGEKAASLAAAGSVAPYVAGAELLVKRVAKGEPLPSSVDELCDAIITKTLENAGYDLALHPLNTRTRSEYEAWKRGTPIGEGAARPEPGAKAGRRAGPAEPEGVAGATAPTSEKATAGARAAAAEQAPRNMPEEAVRSLLRSGGGWERLRTELETGSGLGSGLSVPERRALLSRFETHREMLAGEVASLFGGEVLVTGPAGASTVEVRVSGPEAGQRAAQAKAYLDARRPGWAEETGVVLEAREATVDEGPWVERTRKEIELRSTDPEVLRIAMKLGSRFSAWPKTVIERIELFRAVLHEEMQAAGVPEAEIEVTGRGPLFDHRTWRIEVPRSLVANDNPSPADFARMCNTFAHEARHVAQMFQAARTATPFEAAGMDMKPDILKEAQQAGLQGGGNVKQLDKASLDYADARAYLESIWGVGATGNPARDALLAEKTGKLDTAVAAYEEAAAREKAAAERARKFRGAPEGPLRRNAERAYQEAKADLDAARAERDRHYDAYRSLIEEVDAWAHGGAVEAAVLRYIKLARSLEAAQVAEQQAFGDLSAARERYLQGSGDGRAAGEAYAQALGRWRQLVDETEAKAGQLAAVVRQRKRP